MPSKNNSQRSVTLAMLWEGRRLLAGSLSGTDVVSVSVESDVREFLYVLFILSALSGRRRAIIRHR
jgi:hypothetical protein